MTVLESKDFAVFFEAVTGNPPYPWQERLTEYVLEKEKWPEVIDLPTGAGKTAVLYIAVFTMIFKPTIFPRRIVFVIDRRIVVDQTSNEAERISYWFGLRDNEVLEKMKERLKCKELSESEIVEKAGKFTKVIQTLRKRLKEISGGHVLGVAKLRGGVPISNEWSKRPDQPWIMVSTVDQFGSRLLFRGYGVSSSMRPIHAGLAGNDCLVILDEVHLSMPFAETLKRISALEESSKICRKFAVVEMSATPSNETAERFELDCSDLKEGEELAGRLKVEKKAKLTEISDIDSLPDKVYEIAKSVAANFNDNGVCSLAVVVNLVQTAREVYKRLNKEDMWNTYLITGRMRPLDKTEIIKTIKPIVDPKNHENICKKPADKGVKRDDEQQLDKFTIIVATQSIEVGADFSFDALITQCAAIDSLKQRFGRLDRRGNYKKRTKRASKACIIGVKSIFSSKGQDPVYGDSTKQTWKALKSRFKGEFDVGPLKLKLNEFKNNDKLIAPRDHAPLLLTTHMESWIQTHPEPIVQPPIARFLHGMNQKHIPDVSIAWRWDRSYNALRLVPPRQAEFLSVPINAAKSWLSGGNEVDVADVDRNSDLNISTPSSDIDERSKDWVRYEKTERDKIKIERVDIKDIRPGDILVVDPRRGGIKAGTWDHQSDEQIEDLGDKAQIYSEQKTTLRLDQLMVSKLDAGHPPIPSDEEDADQHVRTRINEWLEKVKCSNTTPQWINEVIGKLGDNFEIESVGTENNTSESDYYIIFESQKPSTKTSAKVALKYHMEGVGTRAECIAKHLNLNSELVKDLLLAGRLHDIGKIDKRFQLMLVGGDQIEMANLDEPLAKSLPSTHGYKLSNVIRHELSSVAMIRSNPNVLCSAHDKDLVLYLIGSHHGRCRPLPPIIVEKQPQQISYKFDGQTMKASTDLVNSTMAFDMVDRFWLLNKRYGHYGLALLESVLRLADHQQSKEENNDERN